MSKYEDVEAVVAGIDGWLTPEQGRRLFDAARRCPSGGRVVEIGSFRGKSTIVLAKGAPDGAEVVAIDPHAGTDRGPQEFAGFAAEAASDHEIFRVNLATAGVSGRVHHVRYYSSAALGLVDGPVDVLYVDGAHRYGPARADLRDWGARVVDDGTLLIHDSFSSIGVTLAILRELAFGRRLRYIGRTRSLAEYRADLDSGPRSRLRNLARQLAQLPWFARNVALKVALTAGLGTLLRRLGRPVPEWPY